MSSRTGSPTDSSVSDEEPEAEEELVFGKPVVEEIKVERTYGNSGYRKKKAKFGSDKGGKGKADILFKFIGVEEDIDADLLNHLMSSSDAFQISSSLLKFSTDCERVPVHNFSPGYSHPMLSEMTVMYPSSVKCFRLKKIMYCEFMGTRYFFREAS